MLRLHATLRSSVFSVSALLALPAGARAQAVTVVAGDDGSQTPPKISIVCRALESYISFEATPIPAGFFFPGSDPFGDPMTLRGAPLATDPPGALGSADFLVRRLADTQPLNVGESDAVPVEALGLHLSHCEPIVVTGNGGQTAELWGVEVHLSALQAQQPGSMQLTRTHGDGGVSSARLPLSLRFTFTRLFGAPSTVVLDPGPPLVLETADEAWTLVGGPGGFDPAALAIDSVPAGIGVDGDGDGVFEATTIGSGNLQGRVGTSGCAFACVRGERSAPAARILATVVGDADLDGYPSGCDNCPAVFQVDQDDLDGDGIGNACDGQTGAIHLNELYVAQDGPDVDEFVELAGQPGLSLDGLAVLVVDGDAGEHGVLDGAWDLSGRTLALDGLFVLGDSGVPNVDLDLGASDAFEDGTQTFYLVRSADFGVLAALVGSSVDRDRDGVSSIPCLVDEVLETVALTDGDAGDRVYDDAEVNTLGPDEGRLPAGIYRGSDYPSPWCEAYLDFDAEVNQSQPRTPGESNVHCSVPDHSCDCFPVRFPLGDRFCSPGATNSTGASGSLDAFGSPGIEVGDVLLTASALPAGEVGFFLVSRTQRMFQPPGSQGVVCLGDDIGRWSSFVHVGPSFSQQIDLFNLPLNAPGTQMALPGDTLFFQCWYRDGGTNSFTDALGATFF